MGIVTTIIPVYNGEKYIRWTLECLAAQTRRPDRIIVVDDQSTDATEAIVKGFGPLKCEWVRNPQNLGLFPNHNRCLEFASETDYLHIIHSNDVVHPTFYEKLVPPLEKVSGRAMSYSRHSFIREDEPQGPAELGTGPAKVREVSKREFLRGQSELKALQLHSAVLKTNRLAMPCKFRHDLLQLGDVVFHADFSLECERLFEIDQVLSFVRTHSDSATSKNLFNLQTWVLDEWKAASYVNVLMARQHCDSWTHYQKLKMMFAARCRVKAALVSDLRSDYAREIQNAAVSAVGRVRWIASGAIVAARDRLFPKDQSHVRGRMSNASPTQNRSAERQ